MIKLLYITNQISGPGGLERVLSIKASYFAENYGHDVHIITLNDFQDTCFFKFSEKITTHNLSVFGNPIQYILRYRKKIKNKIKAIDPDIVIVCDDGLKGLFLPLLIRKDRPFIYERHVSKLVARGEGKTSLINTMFTNIKYYLMRMGGKRFDSFVVLTEGNLKEWKLNNLKVIPNPLSFAPSATSTLLNKTVIAVGKHCYQKGYDILLPEWSKIVKKFPDWNLEIYGSFHPDHDLKKLALQLGIQESVKLNPPIKDIKEKILNASIHVLSSRYEGFGMVITEAMSCGIPSVSFDCPHGPSDIISDGANGFLAENGNVQMLGDALIKLMENEDLRREMGTNAFKSVNRYAIDAVALRWKELFMEVLKNRPSEVSTIQKN